MPAYQAPAFSSQSTLEDSLKAFIQLTNQSISEVKNATMINAQAIAKMEVQIGQIANHMGEREKGKLPSQPMPNPKLQCIGESSYAHKVGACASYCHIEVWETSGQSSGSS
jgi:hypothetical protein